MREGIEDRGARLLHLPPYSPDLNPTELAFIKLKRLLRSAAARTVGLWTPSAASWPRPGGPDRLVLRRRREGMRAQELCMLLVARAHMR